MLNFQLSKQLPTPEVPTDTQKPYMGMPLVPCHLHQSLHRASTLCCSTSPVFACTWQNLHACGRVSLQVAELIWQLQSIFKQHARMKSVAATAGTDVARKMIILGRECGLAIEMQQVTVQSLVPPQLADVQSADDFMAQLPQVTARVCCSHACPIIQAVILRHSEYACHSMLALHAFCCADKPYCQLP